ncbi:hypothetical protein niasHT_011129 [Heterodera trifolii]|uniref:Uncharacterized protein n=1 Tax=Heterodera trifolii TaxID=157864 RepID=A0ABD2L9G8_9BILA
MPFFSVAFSFLPAFLFSASLLLAFASASAASPPHQKQPQFSPAMSKFAPTAGGGVAGGTQQQFMTAPQCRCKDLDECSKEIEKLVAKCKTEPKCEAHLKKIGNSQKIRQCLADEQKDMEKLEQCVEKAVGPIGCTNDEHPKNLTVPIIPEMNEENGQMPNTASGGRRRRSAGTVPALPATQEDGHAPPELSDYLMCVDQCAVKAASPDASPTLCATREGNMNCAFRLKCALMPPNERQEKAFGDCEQKLGLTAQKRLKKSCECLKASGIKIVCPK